MRIYTYHGLLIICSLLCILPASYAAQEGLITYDKTWVTESRQNLALIGSPGHVNTTDLRPFVSRYDSRFRYHYAMADKTALAHLPLALKFADGLKPSLLGHGWRLTFTADFDKPHDLDILSPHVGLRQYKGLWRVIIGMSSIAVQRKQENNITIFEAEPDHHKWVWRFIAVKSPLSETGFALPFEILRPNGPCISFKYNRSGPRPRLEMIKVGDAVLKVDYAATEAGTWNLTNLLLQKPGLSNATWNFQYRSPSAAKGSYLSAIVINGVQHVPTKLRFSYRVFESRQAELRSKRTSAKSIWRAVKNDPRYVLPEGMDIAFRPGLRLIHFDQDSEFDLLDAQEGRPLRAWQWSDAGAWREVSKLFRPKRPLVGAWSSKGTVLSSLHMEFLNSPGKNTKGFQSMIVSYYRPNNETQAELEYVSYVCFPRVKTFNGHQVFDPDPETNATWRCMDVNDEHPFKLQVPLQYEGVPWPKPKPGLNSVERVGNQGTQFLDLDLKNNGGPSLFYMGLLYRDADSGQNIFKQTRHRNTGNCSFRYQTKWGDRKVNVYLCQGVWQARLAYWTDNYFELYGNLPFWKRMDLNGNGEANGRYILPFGNNPAYLAHYERFESVQFAKLGQGEWSADEWTEYIMFAVVKGAARTGEGPERDRPAAREIYGLIDGLWVWKPLSITSSFYPPGAFFNKHNQAYLVDIDGNGFDDAVIKILKPDHTSVWRVYLNTRNTPRWLESPAYRLPKDCDLSNGNFQLIDLDQDDDLDLFKNTGNLVYINEGNPARTRRQSYMRFFTDENGDYRSVEALNIEP